MWNDPVCLIRLKNSGSTSNTSGEMVAKAPSIILASHQTTSPNIWSHWEAAGESTESSDPGFGVLRKHIYRLVLCLQPCTDERFPPGGSSVPLPGLCGLSQISRGSRRALSAAPSLPHHPQAPPATEAPAAGPAQLEQPALTWSLLQLSDTEGRRFEGCF